MAKEQVQLNAKSRRERGRMSEGQRKQGPDRELGGLGNERPGDNILYYARDEIKAMSGV